MSGNPVTDFAKWMRDTNRRLSNLERRSQPTVVDLLGPGFGSQATRVSDWNHPSSLATGFYFSTVGAINTPGDTHNWIGTVICDDAGNGLQQLLRYAEPSPTYLTGWSPVRFTRAWATISGTPTFTAWT